MALTKLMELLQSVCTSGAKDHVALHIAVDILHSLLRVTKLNLDNTQFEIVELTEGVTLDFFSALCVHLCRFGVTKKIIDITEGRIRNADTQEELLDANVRAKAMQIVQQIRTRLVKELQLPEETLYGKSKPLMAICNHLRSGNEVGLKLLAEMLSKEQNIVASACDLASNVKQQSFVLTQDGITTFEVGV